MPCVWVMASPSTCSKRYEEMSIAATRSMEYAPMLLCSYSTMLCYSHLLNKNVTTPRRPSSLTSNCALIKQHYTHESQPALTSGLTGAKPSLRGSRGYCWFVGFETCVQNPSSTCNANTYLLRMWPKWQSTAQIIMPSHCFLIQHYSFHLQHRTWSASEQELKHQPVLLRRSPLPRRLVVITYIFKLSSAWFLWMEREIRQHFI